MNLKFEVLEFKIRSKRIVREYNRLKKNLNFVHHMWWNLFLFSISMQKTCCAI